MVWTWLELGVKGDKGETGDTGPTGASGVDGHTPIHVSTTEPTEDVRVGDQWFHPDTHALKVCASGT